MGDRCNLVILENGRFDLYYDRWAAIHLDVELFWGPEIARQFIEAHDPQPNSWLDSVSCEGACVLDFDTNHLLWYGGDDVAYCPADNLAHQELMLGQWDGWHVEWAKDGLFDIASKLGVPRSTIETSWTPEIRQLQHPRTEPHEGSILLLADGLVSYRANDATAFSIVRGDQYSCLHSEISQSSLCSFVELFDLKKFQSDRSVDKDWENLSWGIHINFDDRKIDTWYPCPAEGFLELLADRWAVFDVTFHGPDYLWHKRLFPEVGLPELDQEARTRRLDHIRRSLERDDTNPELRALDGFRQHMPEAKIETNPSILHHRQTDSDLLLHKRRILSQLKKAVVT